MGIDIPGFIRYLREGRLQAAYAVIRQKNPLPSVCGRICAAPCQRVCVLNEEKAPIAIRALERFVSDHGGVRSVEKRYSFSRRVAIIGSGPSGLAAADVLNQKGYGATIFEAMDEPGGAPRQGVPEFRLPWRRVAQDIKDLRARGIDIKTARFMARPSVLADLWREGFSAVLLAPGSGVPRWVEIPGTHWGGVYYGEEFLLRVNRRRQGWGRPVINIPLGRESAVIGTGPMALDCARALVRLGSRVTVVFPRSDDETFPEEDRTMAEEEGVMFESLVKPLAIQGDRDGWVNGLKCRRLDYAEAETGGVQWTLQEVPASEFVLKASTVILAVGQRPNTFIQRFLKDLKLNEDGTIAVDPVSRMTSIDKVFAAGNGVLGPGSLARAMADGKRAAEAMDAYLKFL